jgi:hypothetical protein
MLFNIHTSIKFNQELFKKVRDRLPCVVTVTHACRKRRLKWVATLPLGDINTEAWSFGTRVGRGANNLTL